MKNRSLQNDTPSTIFFIRRFKNTKVTFALSIITLTWSSLIPFLRWCSSRNKLFTPNPMLIIYTIFWQGHVCRNSILKNSKKTYTMNWRNKSNDKKSENFISIFPFYPSLIGASKQLWWSFYQTHFTLLPRVFRNSFPCKKINEHKDPGQVNMSFPYIISAFH